MARLSPVAAGVAAALLAAVLLVGAADAGSPYREHDSYSDGYRDGYRDGFRDGCPRDDAHAHRDGSSRHGSSRDGLAHAPRYPYGGPSCQATESCVPTIKQYDNLDPTGAAPFSEWPKCNGPFVLCAVANCSIIASSGTPKVPLQAECGCLLPDRATGGSSPSYVTPNIIKSKAVSDATIERCFNGVDPAQGGVNTCTEVNSAPVCKAINQDTMYGGVWPLISTFVEAYRDQGVQQCTAADDGSSLVADCMTAACYETPAFDGSDYVCYCPVYQIPAGQPYAIGYPRSKFPDGIPCDQPDGFVISGAATA